MKRMRGDLGELGRLDTKAAEAEPAAGPVDRRAEQHARPAARRPTPDQRPDERVVPVGAVVDPHRDRQHRQAEHAPTAPGA